MMTEADTCADCGHHRNTHFWERCSQCDRDAWHGAWRAGCDCEEDNPDVYLDGCDDCWSCEGFREMKTAQPADPDPSQLALFGAADA